MPSTYTGSLSCPLQVQRKCGIICFSTSPFNSRTSQARNSWRRVASATLARPAPTSYHVSMSHACCSGGRYTCVIPVGFAQSAAVQGDPLQTVRSFFPNRLFLLCLQIHLHNLFLNRRECPRFCSQSNHRTCTFTCHFRLSGCPFSLLEQLLHP